MKPLREQLSSQEPITRRAAELVSAVGPLAASRSRMRRVRARVESRTMPRGFALLRPAVVVGFLFGGIATAGATWGVVRLVTDEPSLEKAPSTPTQNPLPQPAKSQPRGSAPREDSVLEEPDILDLDAEPAGEGAPRESGSTGSRAARAHADRATPAQDGARSELARARLSDSVLVHRAVQALRNGGNAQKASELLERYRERHPDGVLAEEALALAIEAAVAKKDPNAKRLAHQYLAKYPNGRFASAARRAAR